MSPENIVYGNAKTSIFVNKLTTKDWFLSCYHLKALNIEINLFFRSFFCKQCVCYFNFKLDRWSS